MILDLLTKEERKLLQIIHLKKDNILFFENDICTSVCVVINGEINITSFTFEGNEIVYNSLKAGDIFGNNLLFSKDQRYKGNVIAKTNTTLALINKENLIYILQQNEEFLTRYLEIHSEFSKALNSKIKILSFKNAKERFLYYLFINDGKISFKSVSNLAHSLFLTREVTSRLISQMIKDKEIKRIGNTIYKEG